MGRVPISRHITLQESEQAEVSLLGSTLKMSLEHFTCRTQFLLDTSAKLI